MSRGDEQTVSTNLKIKIQTGNSTALEDVQGATSYANTLTGNLKDNKLWGGNANDVFYGNEGNDDIYGNLGNDTATGGAGSDGRNSVETLLDTFERVI